MVSKPEAAGRRSDERAPGKFFPRPLLLIKALDSSDNTRRTESFFSS